MKLKKTTKFKVLDLFSGCGGLSYGFEKAGFQIIAGIDHWNISLKTFKRNHRNAQISDIDLSRFRIEDIERLLNGAKPDVIIGGPPCQGFSISGKRDPDDPRNKLYQAYVTLIEKYQPKAFVMENVPNLLVMNDGKVKDTIIQEFTNLGYMVKYKVLLASDYGVPQNRRRVFIVGLRDGKEFEFPIPIFVNNKVTSSEALSDLPEDEVTDGGKYLLKPQSKYQELMRNESNGIFNHQITKHSAQTISIIALVPDGGNYKNLPLELQSTRRVHIAWTRLNSKKPSFTIDTGHNHHFHYKYNRVPTARESARIQSFPDIFIFEGTKNEQLKQIGNAVPPLLAQAVASKLLEYLQ